MKKTTVCAVAALAASGVLSTALRAEAADCGTFTNPVYISGSSASQPIWTALVKANALPGMSIIYIPDSSCVGLSDVTTSVAGKKPPIYIDGTPLGQACTNPAPTQIGVSDVFPTSCGTSITWPATGYAEFQGPVQVMLMAVPYQSTESSINYDAAYTVFGWGGVNPSYQVAPWIDYTQVFIRSPTSGTETMIGAAIGLAPSKWLSQAPDGGSAQQEPNSGAVLKALQAAAGGATPNAAIGILAADLGDTYRGALGVGDAGATTGGLKILAYQAKDQTCGYLPDSDATHYDKINVRQGRYDIWGPLHLVAAVDASGNPTDANVKTIISMITANGLTDAQYTTLIGADAGAHVIPQCAMQVSRSAEVSPITGGGMASYQPPEGCGCYYETLVNGNATYSKYCKTCTADTDCASTASYPKCHFGYCEAK
jgi:hypothetical protein